ncbi:putative exopolygalacturonase B [Drechslerella stenobrocha 248]|uniref:galacturonan 1,4-alpha-galacturonidase n=1 Tax=Drechslerella stenobrocha 248 TaxID=1043628 RepID=W7I503_9PEZI|nr:putative exopolygalacturonase B [Drechslerella stenobrocha 248]
MKFSQLTALAGAIAATFAAAVPDYSELNALEEHALYPHARVAKRFNSSQHRLSFPNTLLGERGPDKHLVPYTRPHFSYRRKVYIRPSVDETDDVSDEFLAGIQEANNGGTLILRQQETYVLGKKLDLTFLNNIHVELRGEILFTNDTTYWQNNYFYHPFQKSIAFWKWGGTNILIYGNGILNGNGQAWYDGFAGLEILNPDNTYYRPILFYAENATNLRIEGIQFRNSPCWTNFIVTSKNVAYDNVIIDNQSKNQNRPKNTDGFDSYNVDGISFTNSYINIGDDCFSPKPNTSNIFVKNLWCNGTHGIPMGSIGQYAGVKDVIENVHVEDIVMLNAQCGARLKAWAGRSAGYGYIRNVTFKNFYNYNTDQPIVLDQCYFNINATECSSYPSQVDLANINFINFTGQSSGKYKKVVVDLKCSPGAVCEGIRLEDIWTTSPKGSPPVAVCRNIVGGVGIPCTPEGAPL